MMIKYVHLHGFGSDRNSSKGLYLQRKLQEKGIELVLPELNQPSFEEITLSGALEELDRVLGAEKGVVWRISASSMGGYLAALWAKRNPEKVDRLVLLCPGFDLATQFVQIVGVARMKRWERDGFLLLPGADEELRPVHWEFINDARGFEPFPEVPCPTLIIHGVQDDTIPLESSRRYVEQYSEVGLMEVRDDHSMMNQIEVISAETVKFLSGNEGK